MSLNWDAKNCDPRALEDDAAREITKAITFVTMAVDMGSITTNNLDEFVDRVTRYETQQGAIMTFWDGKGIKDRPLTYEDIVLRVGLRTNVRTLGIRAFNAKLKRLAAEKERQAQR